MKKDLGKVHAGLRAWLIVGLVAGLTAGAMADGQKDNDWFSVMNDQEVARVMAQDVPGTGDAMEEEVGSTKMIPWLTISVDYAMVSDYIWRGLNFSEYDTEGREKLNHQLGLTTEIDLAELTGQPIGKVGANVWFEWFVGQERLTTWSDNNLQETDYTLYWGMDIPDTPFGIEFGWIAYHFPRVRDSGSEDATDAERPRGSDAAYTHEVYGSVSYDDSDTLGTLLGIDGPVLSPELTYYQDLDDVQAGIITLGISHEFAMADYGCTDVMVLKDLTVTPKAILTVDHRYYDKADVGSNRDAADASKGTKLAYLQYQVDVALDLNGVFDIPAQFGNFTVGGFLAYTNSFHDEAAGVQDEFWGGMTFGWSW
jgi:hypothetical protein